MPKYTRPTFKNLLFLGFGTLLILSSLFYRAYSAKVLSFSTQPKANNITSEDFSRPTSIEIPSAKINVLVSESKIEGNTWEISPNGASHLDISASPGSNGNIIIYGHNKKAVFGNLFKTRIGDLIKLHTNDGKIYEYKVEKVVFIDPTQLEYIQPTTRETLTVYTCTGFLDSKRLLIKALKVT